MKVSKNSKSSVDKHL